MAPTQFQPSKLYARDIIRYSDTELDQYLEANGRLVEVEDPKNLPEDFIDRLRARAGTSQSHPIDLYDLSARLQHVSANGQARPRSPSLASDYRSRETTESLNEEEDYRRDLAKQTKYYDILVNEGGRPSHPVSLGRDILQDPGEYHEILSYWQKVNQDGEGRVWQVFRSQLGRWQDFRKWQRRNREDGRFPKYAEDVKQGLAEHGFTRLFQLDEDPEQQDKLTTWIEFLDYEYWYYDKDIRFVKRHQLRYDEAWKTLVDSNVLRPSETEEFICNIDSAFQRASEEEHAEQAVESAKSAVVSAKNAVTDLQRSKKEAQQLLLARSRLDAAIKSLESIKRRNDLVSEFQTKTKNYQIAKENVERRGILLRWILLQAPLIELELNHSKMAEDDSKRQRDGKRGSKRNRADECDEERLSKRQRQDGESNPISDRRTRAISGKGCESHVKRSHGHLRNEGQASKRAKHNVSEIPGIADPTAIGERHSFHPLTAEDFEATEATSKHTRSKAKIRAGVDTDEKARVVKRGRRVGKSSNPSVLGSPLLRRSTRLRRPPDRFQ